MDSSTALKYHLQTFKLSGFWPNSQDTNTNSNNLYNIWTVANFVVLGVLFPLSQIVNVYFADSITEMVDRSIITSSIVVVVIKALNLYANQNKLMELFNNLKNLDDEIKDRNHIQLVNAAIKLGQQIYFIYLYPYVLTCVLLVFQTIYSSPKIRLWSSTYAYPFEWAQQTHIYVSGLFVQAIANTCIVIFAVAVDTYGVVLIHLLSTHIGVLHNRLERIGYNTLETFDNKLYIDNYNELIHCCNIYERVLRCSKLLEDALGTALFAQFGVSGFVLCTSAYQLTVVPPDDISKLSFVIVYFLCMLTEIFVPCFFGSFLLAESDLLMRKIYESNWIQQNNNYKQAMYMFVIQSSHPIHLCVNKIFLLDLHTFLKILRTAWSLLALLKNI